ncbi:hypothetical protein NpPPO83_00009754 [Neofusicoccum parvum]|uniref:Uncharacterized protein n=1 Tax=Neofusicoccum parvum TaxID=310453 RepID=A0ACB5S557_9PEZI|nr:hypothetical protein NpPPO83_00009754 [Neofusicoccum parvum]
MPDSVPPEQQQSFPATAFAVSTQAVSGPPLGYADPAATTRRRRPIHDLAKQVEDLKDIVAGISVAEDCDTAAATARQLAADDFQHAAAVADAFRTEHGGTAEDLRKKSSQLHERRDYLRRTSKAMAPGTMDSHTSSSSKAAADSVGLDESGAMGFPPWLFDREAEVLGFTHTSFPETAPMEVRILRFFVTVQA